VAVAKRGGGGGSGGGGRWLCDDEGVATSPVSGLMRVAAAVRLGLEFQVGEVPVKLEGGGVVGTPP
jgi:hypothetical protein